MATQRLSDERLAEIRERCEKATNGPWHKITVGDDAVIAAQLFDGWPFISAMSYKGKGVSWMLSTEQCLTNVDFIAHARQDIPDLLAEIERLRQAIELGGK